MFYDHPKDSTIFTQQIKRFEDFKTATVCQTTKFTNLFSESSFGKVSLVVKKSGEMTWTVPNGQTLSCENPALANVEFISFSEYGSNTVDYRMDCDSDEKKSVYLN